MRARAVRNAPALPVFDGVGAAAVEHDALRQCRGLDVQIAAALRRAEIGDRGARAPAAPRRGLEEAGAFLGRAVEIGIDGDAGLGRGLDEGLRERIGDAAKSDTGSGPPAPWKSSAPRCWFSAFLK